VSIKMTINLFQDIKIKVNLFTALYLLVTMRIIKVLTFIDLYEIG